MSTLSLSKKHIFFLFSLCFFFFPVSSFAAIEIPVTVSTSGEVTFNCPETGNITRWYHYEGVHPDIVRIVSNFTGTADCEAFIASSPSLEGGFANQAASTTDGEYWLQFSMNNNLTNEYFFRASRSNGVWSSISSSTNPLFPTFSYVEGIQSIENTRFLDVGVSARTINPKDVLINVSYFLDPTEVQRNVSSRNPTLVTVKWANRNSLDFSTLGFAIATSTGTGTVLATIPDGSISDNGTFDLLIQFSNGGCSIGLSECPFPDSYIYTDFTLTNKVVSRVGLLENYNYLPTASSSNQYLDCGILELGGCLVNVAIFLFTPSEVSLNNLQEYKNTLPTKEPFAYFFAYKDLVASQSVSSASQSLSIDMTPANLGTIVILSEQNTNAILGSQTLVTLRTVMSGLIWFLTFIFIILTSVYALNKFRV